MEDCTDLQGNLPELYPTLARHSGAYRPRALRRQRLQGEYNQRKKANAKVFNLHGALQGSLPDSGIGEQASNRPAASQSTTPPAAPVPVSPSKTKTKGPVHPRASSHGIRRAPSHTASEQPRRRSARLNQADLQQQARIETAAPVPLDDADDEWRPSLVIGSPLGENISRIKQANRQIRQWRAILKHHKEHYGSPAPYLESLLQNAIEERQALEDTPENSLPANLLASTKTAAVDSRVNTLKTVLAESTCPSERTNIEAAIQGYATGEIGFSSVYTLIYEGHIVDRCALYEDFLADRAERIHGYREQHGDGWLWWEPPLATPGGAAVCAKKGTVLVADPAWRAGTNDQGGYEVVMGFRPRRKMVSGSLQVATAAAAAAKSASAATGAGGGGVPVASARRRRLLPKMEADPAAETRLFSMLLDSGAVYPSLYAADFAALGVDPASYAAQSAVVMQTMGGDRPARVYELDAGVAFADDDDGHTGSGWPAEPRRLLLGAPVPVPVILVGGAGPPPRGGGHGNRVSGILPFHACYVAGAPGLGRLWLGEDRRDVLGNQRMPGQLRYARPGRAPDAAAAATAHRRHLWPKLGSPAGMVFRQELDDGSGRVLVDEDLGDGSSRISLVGGASGTTEDCWRIEPRRRDGQKEAAPQGMQPAGTGRQNSADATTSGKNMRGRRATAALPTGQRWQQFTSEWQTQRA